MTSTWTTQRDIETKVKRRWDDGTLLGAQADGVLEPIIVPIRGPRPSEIGDDLTAVRGWISDLESGSNNGRRYTLTWQTVGGRHIGRNQIPTHAVISTLEQVWTLLGVSPLARKFGKILDLTAAIPAVRTWVLAHPHRALALHDVMPTLISAYTWLDTHRDSDVYLRTINAPGVDTKFAERHRAVLAAMLGTPSSSSGFLEALGLRNKPEFVRLRPAPSLGLPAALTELAIRAEELVELPITPRRALVIENEITYLSVDIPDDGIVLWGKGFDVDRIGRLPWLVDTPVTYWGDIDTHGFAILDRLRAWLPHTRSVLMDRETLTTHRDRWVIEDRPTTSSLKRLTPEEQDLYADLVSDHLGDKVRLEQERIDWSWVEEALGPR